MAESVKYIDNISKILHYVNLHLTLGSIRAVQCVLFQSSNVTVLKKINTLNIQSFEIRRTKKTLKIQLTTNKPENIQLKIQLHVTIGH